MDNQELLRCIQYELSRQEQDEENYEVSIKGYKWLLENVYAREA